MEDSPRGEADSPGWLKILGSKKLRGRMQLARRAGAGVLPGPRAAWLDLLRRQLRDAAATVAQRRVVALYYRGNLDGAEGQPISLLYVGLETHAREFEMYLGGDGTRAPPSPERLFRGTLLDYLWPRRRAETAGLDADVVVRQMFFPTVAHKGELLHLPFIDGVLPMVGSAEAQIQKVRSKAHRRRLRRVLRSPSHSWRITTSPADFELFYSTMYEPYVRQKFGLRAQLDSRQALGELFRRSGRILLVSHLDKPVSGSLLFERAASGILFYHRNGFLNGASLPPLLMAERTAALELALMQYASDSGARLIHLGFTRAILSSGLFIHKRRLGCSFTASTYSPVFRLGVRVALRPAVFARFPLLSGPEGAFVANLGYTGGGPCGTVRRWRGVVKNYFFPGLTRVVLHTDTGPLDPGLIAYSTALRQVLGGTPLIVASSSSAE